MNKIKPDQILAHALAFTEDDLEANRNLHLSQHQYQNKKSDIEKMLLYTSLFWVLLPISLIIVPVVFLMVTTHLSLLRMDLLYILLTFIAMGITLSVVHQHYKDKLSKLTLDVEQHEGRIKLNVQGNLFSLYINEQTFTISKQVFLAFKNNDPYVIYTYDGQIISAEWLNTSPFIGDAADEKIYLT